MRIKGTIILEIISADPTGFLTELQNQSIPLSQIALKDELTLRLEIDRKYYKNVMQLAEKRGAQLGKRNVSGLYYKTQVFLRRPILIIGLIVLLCLTFFLPTILLFFRVEGNVTVSSRRIIALAADHGLSFGAIRRDVRSEKIKNALLKSIPELEWVGINTAGCVATISVREREKEMNVDQTSGVSSIVATRDGIIQDLLVTAGSPSAKVGDTVKKGQILISGYTDCGLSIRAERAKGEVYATTTYDLTLVFPVNEVNYRSDTNITENFFLIFGKNRINFSESSGILDVGCVKMYEEKYVTLPGGFVLPLGIATEHSINDVPADNIPSRENALRLAAERYLQSQMIAGQILSREEQIWQEDGYWYLEGSYVCLEMIGIEQNEEIITP